MHGGCYLCSRQSTSQREHCEPQLLGKEIFIDIDMGHRAFMSFIRMMQNKSNCLCFAHTGLTSCYFTSYSLIAEWENKKN